MVSTMVWSWRLFCLFSLWGTVISISFTVEPDEKKCIREEVHKDVLVVGTYELSDVPGQVTDIIVSLAYRLSCMNRCSYSRSTPHFFSDVELLIVAHCSIFVLF